MGKDVQKKIDEINERIRKITVQLTMGDCSEEELENISLQIQKLRTELDNLKSGKYEDYRFRNRKEEENLLVGGR